MGKIFISGLCVQKRYFSKHRRELSHVIQYLCESYDKQGHRYSGALVICYSNDACINSLAELPKLIEFSNSSID